MTEETMPHDRALTRDELRAWLDRKPPPPPADQRPWEEFELARVVDVQMEAGHA